MDRQFLDGMRARLVDMRETLVEVADTAAESSQTVELDQSRVGRLSRMDAMQLQAMAQESGRRRAESLRMISAAIQRIEGGDYGMCLDCEEPIPEARLTFDPAAERCIDCASAHESERDR